MASGFRNSTGPSVGQPVHLPSSRPAGTVVTWTGPAGPEQFELTDEVLSDGMYAADRATLPGVRRGAACRDPASRRVVVGLGRRLLGPRTARARRRPRPDLPPRPGTDLRRSGLRQPSVQLSRSGLPGPDVRRAPQSHSPARRDTGRRGRLRGRHRRTEVGLVPHCRRPARHRPGNRSAVLARGSRPRSALRSVPSVRGERTRAHRPTDGRTVRALAPLGGPTLQSEDSRASIRDRGSGIGNRVRPSSGVSPSSQSGISAMTVGHALDISVSKIPDPATRDQLCVSSRRPVAAASGMTSSLPVVRRASRSLWAWAASDSA